MTITELAPELDEPRVDFVVKRDLRDRTFRGTTTAAGFTTFVLMGLIGGYLLYRGWDALQTAGWGFFTVQAWNVSQGGDFGIAAVLPYTFQIAIVAIVLAVPVSVLAALFITEYAPAWAQRILTITIDLLAAVPSLIFGMWGRAYLMPRLITLSDWLAEHLPFIPFFKVKPAQEGIPLSLGDFGGSTFAAGVVVALMIVPICTAVIRQVFSQTPPGEKEGALALGGTRWGVVRDVVLPFGRGGIIGGAMLGLGRALGETIAVTLIISESYERKLSILGQGSNSIAALIATKNGESSPFSISALMAAGLVLFLVTIAVNSLASVIIGRSRSGATTEI